MNNKLFIGVILAFTCIVAATAGQQSSNKEQTVQAQTDISEPNQKLIDAAKNNDLAGVEHALQSGASVNVRGERNTTALMYAVDHNNLHLTELLLKHRANPNLKANDDYSPMLLAVTSYKKQPALLHKLIQYGGDPNITGPDKDPILMHFTVTHNCEAIRYMHSIGANLDAKTGAGTPLLLDTALASDWDAVWCLLELGARFDYKNHKGIHNLSHSLNTDQIHSDSPLFPYKKKVWIYLKQKGINDLLPLFDDPDHLGAEKSDV